MNKLRRKILRQDYVKFIDIEFLTFYSGASAVELPIEVSICIYKVCNIEGKCIFKPEKEYTWKFCMKDNYSKKRAREYGFDLKDGTYNNKLSDFLKELENIESKYQGYTFSFGNADSKALLNLVDISGILGKFYNELVGINFKAIKNIANSIIDIQIELQDIVPIRQGSLSLEKICELYCVDFTHSYNSLQDANALSMVALNYINKDIDIEKIIDLSKKYADNIISNRYNRLRKMCCNQ